jgi:hypothetical protein
MKHKYLLSTMILFVFLFLFFTTSLALIPGDFGSANNGPPDGVVDFEDLMIFAMTYGSTPADPNWNPLCDIAGQGSTTPDGVIDFEDLMVFAMHYGEEEEIIIPDTTEVIDEETEQVVAFVSEDQSTIIFSNSTTQTDRIDPGDIIVMGVTDQTPYGLLRRVTSINRGLTKEGQVILDTEFTTLEEAIQKGHWEYNHTLKPEDIEKGFVFPEGIQPVRGKASTTLDHEYEINVILYDQDDNPATIEDNIMATGYLAFNYQIIFDGDIDGHTLKYFLFKNIIQTDSKLDISVGASVSIADLADIGDVTIGKPIPFNPVTVPIPTPLGILPLVFFPSIELKAGIEGEAHNIVLEAGVRQTASYTAGIEFTEGNWQNITTPPQVDYYEDPIEVNGGIHIIAHAGPQLNCKLYTVAGPYCNSFGSLDFNADTTLDPWWDLDGGLEVSAGVKLDIFTIHWKSGELELINLTRDVADAGGPFEQEILTPEEIELIREYGYDSEYVVRWPDGYVDVYDKTNYSRMQEVINEWNSAIGGPVILRLSSNPNSPVKVVFDSSLEEEGSCGNWDIGWEEDYTLSMIDVRINPNGSSCGYPNTSYSLYLFMFKNVAGFEGWTTKVPYEEWSNFTTINDTMKKMVHALHKVPPGYYLGKINQSSDIIEENIQLGTNGGCACNCRK